MAVKKPESNVLMTVVSAVAVFAALLLALLIAALNARNFLWSSFFLWSGIVIVGVFTLLLFWYILCLHQLRAERVDSEKLLSILRRILHELYPALYWIAGFFKLDKNTLESAYVDMNNRIIRRLVSKVVSRKILVLLPHCLQWDQCPHKIVGDGSRCVGCGRCQIADLVQMMKERKLPMIIASGGTLARKAILEHRPELIIAVACERDLASGIYDMRKLPVIGLLNQRPEGPCRNTRVDMTELMALIEQYALSEES